MASKAVIRIPQGSAKMRVGNWPGDFSRFARSSRILISAMIATALWVCATAAWAKCDDADRPKTPTLTKATLMLDAQHRRVLRLEWLNAQTRTGMTLFDIHVWDQTGKILTGVNAGAAQEMTAGKIGVADIPADVIYARNLQSVTVSMRSRTPKGCVSEPESPKIVAYLNGPPTQANAGRLGLPQPPTSPSTTTAPQPGVNKVLQYAQSHIAQRLGAGQCTDLVAAALAYAGDQPGNTSSPNGQYTWGRMLNIWQEAPQPGDVIQLVDVTLSYSTPTSSGTWSTNTQHSAIIESVTNGRQLNVIQQNAPIGSPVARGVINLNWTVVKGSYAIFRPVPNNH